MHDKKGGKVTSDVEKIPFLHQILKKSVCWDPWAKLKEKEKENK